jgi:tetratricopeptide (TPR) repeat protein
MQEFHPDDTVLNRYRVLRKLGAGAMGSVYLCEDSVENNVKVALKVLVSENLDDQDVWAKGEYEALTRLRHPNLARVYNFGRIEATSEYFIVSEFIKGVDLFSATEYLNYEELADILVQICRALEYIHSQGYVHFDIKPDNILVTRHKTVGIKDGSKVMYEARHVSERQLALTKPLVKVIDFGLAEKITGSFQFAIKGTLNYLAPEILGGRTPDKRADLYSLGVTIFQVANRNLPFQQEFEPFDTGQRRPKRSELFEIHLKKHPEFLRRVILKLIEENPDDRFRSAREVIEFINKHSDYKFEVETEETRASYFYSARLIGRKRESNLLREYYHGLFRPLGEGQQGAVARAAAPNAVPGASEDETQGASDEAASGECPALVLVTGEMGSGKSRLIEDFHHFLRLNDLPLFAGNCYEGNTRAYQPMVEILRQLVYRHGLDSGLYKEYCHEIWKLIPELRAGPAPEGPSREMSFRPDKERIYFIERVVQLLIDGARSAPYVLVVNNLHWIDDASVELLEKFLERLVEVRRSDSSVKLLVIASLRPEEPALQRLSRFLERIREARQCREIQIRRLKHAQIHDLLRSMLNFSDVPEQFVTKLEEATRGNPLFIVETLKALQDEGIIKNAGESWIIGTARHESLEIPRSMEGLLGQRLERIKSPQRELLEVLSVIGKPVAPKFVQRLKCFAKEPILAPLQDLEAMGLVTKRCEEGKLSFEIPQPKVREILYAGIPGEKRQAYHGEVAAALQEAFRGRDEEILEDLAYHYQRGDQQGKALEVTIRAGDWLRGIFANERAYDCYLFVLQQVEGVPAHFNTWVETHEKMGDLCVTLGRYDIADRSYGLLLDMQQCLGPDRLVKIHLSRGRVFEIQGDYDSALKCYKDARNFLSGLGQSNLLVERIHVFNSIGWVYVCTGKYEKAMAISLEALRVIEGMPASIEHAMLYNTIGSANFCKGNTREAIDYHKRSLEIREHLENIPEIITSLNNLGSAHMAGCEYGEAREHLRRALESSEAIGDPYGKAMTLHNFALLYFAVGQREKGWEHVQESLRLAKSYNMRYLNVQNYIVRGKALREEGQYAKAESNLFRALTAFTKQGNRWGLCIVLLELAALQRLVGNHAEARGSLEEAAGYADDLDIRHLRVSCLLEDARLLRETDDGEDLAVAIAQLGTAAALADRCGHAELQGEVAYETGETLVRLRQLREAKEHYALSESKYREVLDNLPSEFRASYRPHGLELAEGGRILLRAEMPRASGAGGAGDRHGDDTRPEAPAARAAAPEAAPTVAVSRGIAAPLLHRLSKLLDSLGKGGLLSVYLRGFFDEILDAARADMVLWLAVSGHEVELKSSRSRPNCRLGEPESLISLGLVERALTDGRPVYKSAPAKDLAIARELGRHVAQVTSLGACPFRAGDDCQGLLYLVNVQAPAEPPPPGDEALGALWFLQPFASLLPLAERQLHREGTPV